LKEYSTQKLLLGTHTSDNEQNYLMIAEVQLPLEDTEVDARAYEADQPDGSGGFGAGAGKVQVRCRRWLVTAAGEGELRLSARRRGRGLPVGRRAERREWELLLQFGRHCRGRHCRSRSARCAELPGVDAGAHALARQAIQLINHDGEVNRARFCPQNPFLLATKTVRRDGGVRALRRRAADAPAARRCTSSTTASTRASPPPRGAACRTCG